ncbi:MAG: PIG-L family deacetylase, partial [Clostridiales bacterium]|nr:PIG-L family deacetylase [Clostridiales bacterium]
MKKVFAAMVIAIYMFVGAACMQPQHARAEGGVPFAAARDITKSCTLEVNKGKKSYLTDDKVKTYWGPWPKGSWLEVRLPDGESAGHMILEWFHEPEAYLIEEFDAGGTLLRERDQDCTYKGIHVTYDLLPQTKRILLTVKSDDERISSIKVYSEGALPDTVQSWLPPYEKADVMVVSTHQDDELIFLGGTIPYYTMARGVRVTVMYTVSCGRYRRMEALNGLWAAGVRHYPEFINLKDENISSIDETLKHWGGKEHVLELIVERIRRYRPEVIVAQDLNGEYGHNQHKLTSRMMQPAIEAAADASQFPESYRKYGAWQVKKLYLHLYEENQIRMDWETPLASLGGRSPLDMAKIAYDEHASQHKYYQVKSGGKYDNALFGLVYSAVGPDVARNDMLENIDLTNDDAEAEAFPVTR